MTFGADNASEKAREIACVGNIVGDRVPDLTPANSKVCTGFRSASREVSESGRDGSATAVVAAFELLALSMAIATEPSVTTAINIAIVLMSTPIVNLLV